jgi:hypothetical protein
VQAALDRDVGGLRSVEFGGDRGDNKTSAQRERNPASPEPDVLYNTTGPAPPVEKGCDYIKKLQRWILTDRENFSSGYQ